MQLSQKRLFLLDMDGTLYLDEQLFDGTKEFLSYIREIGGTYLYLTNNSSKGVDAYVAKMRRLGIEATEADFLTSVDVTVHYLLKNKGPEDVYYVCGTESFKSQLRRAGLTLADTPDERVTTVLAGFDTELTFQKLEDACILLNRGADFIATNPDWVCPTWYGYVPDCGSVCEMLTRATGRVPRVLGKPQPEMVYLAMERTGYSADQTAMIGDRIYTDVKSGLNAGVLAILVMSGETTQEILDASEDRPDLVLESAAEILEALR